MDNGILDDILDDIAPSIDVEHCFTNAFQTLRVTHVLVWIVSSIPRVCIHLFPDSNYSSIYCYRSDKFSYFLPNFTTRLFFLSHLYCIYAAPLT